VKPNLGTKERDAVMRIACHARRQFSSITVGVHSVRWFSSSRLRTLGGSRVTQLEFPNPSAARISESYAIDGLLAAFDFSAL
jgi:hypothetical protein